MPSSQHRPRIAIDARTIHQIHDGFSRYAYELCLELPKLAPQYDFIIFRSDKWKQKLFDQPNVEEVFIQGSIKTLSNAALSDKNIFLETFDVFHSLANVLPKKLPTCKKMVTFHDFGWFESSFKNFKIPKAIVLKAYARAYYWRSLKESDAVIAISEWTKDRIAHHVPAVSKKVSVVPHGTRIVKKAHTDFFANEDFFFSIGTRNHKNIARCIKAFVAFRDKNPDLKHRYYILGRFFTPEKYHKLVKATPYANDIIFTGKVSDDIIAEAFAKANALLYPSLFEGFGIPIVDAMKTGCPVITSKRRPMSDIADGHAILVDPEDTHAIAIGLLQSLSLKQEKIDAAKEHANKYTWQETAMRTLDVYKQLIEHA